MSGSISATTLAYVGAAAAVAGTATTVYGSVQQASAAQASAKYQSEVAASNQETALKNASFAAASGEEKAAIQEQKTRAQLGEILTTQGSSGVDINSPTAKAVRTSQTEIGGLDAQTIRSNAAREAYGYQTQSTNFENAAAADIAEGDNAETSGYINAGTGLLKGAGNASLNYASIMNRSSGLGSEYSSPIGPTYPGEAMGG